MNTIQDDDSKGILEVRSRIQPLIEPNNLEELVEAIKVKDELYSILRGIICEDSEIELQELFEEQTLYIDEYIKCLGSFDVTLFATNLNYLCKKNGLRIGMIEDILGISTGYISRTIKDKSKKKMSIDTVWKIAKLFNTDIFTITNSQMWIVHFNTELVSTFINKIYEETKNNLLTWECDGGFLYSLDPKYLDLGLVTELEDDIYEYHPDHMNLDARWLIEKDIVFLNNFDNGMNLAIIPYRSINRPGIDGFDVIMIGDDGDSWHWEKVYYTSDDPHGQLFRLTNKLYNLIEESEEDAKITSSMKLMMSKYIKGGGK